MVMYMERRMWFGTRGWMRWVPACAVNPDFSSVGWSSQTQHLSGMATVNASIASHKEYLMTWNSGTRDELRPIIDFADGVYNSADGKNLIYFLDPTAMDKNVLPQFWATPSQALAGGKSLVPGQVPGSVGGTNNGYDYPARAAVYISNSSSGTLWVPIPPGYTAHIGAHGVANGLAGVLVTPTSGATSAASTKLTMLGTNTDVRTNFTVSGDTYDGMTISFVDNGPSSTDDLILFGMIAQVLPNGSVPASGGFISGQGNSGCQFAEKPSQTPRSAALDSMALSAKLVETGTGL